VAGSGFDVTVLAEDAVGNVDPNFNGMVNLALSSNPGNVMLQGIASGTATAGVLNFSNLQIDTVGSGYVLEATSGTLNPAATNNLTVTPAPAMQLVVMKQPPVSVTAGDGFGFTVKAEDRFDNVDTNFNGTVNLVLQNNPGSSLLQGPISVAASARVATFQGLTIEKGKVKSVLAESQPSEPSKCSLVSPAGARQRNGYSGQLGQCQS